MRYMSKVAKFVFLVFIILLLPLLCLSQNPATPKGYVQPMAQAGLGPNGFAFFRIDNNGALVTTSLTNILAAIPGYVNPVAPVGLDSNGNWQYFKIDSNGALVTGGSGNATSVNGAAVPASATVSGTNPSGQVIPSPFAAQIPTSGLLAEYRILPTETVSALVDYSGNGNTGGATVGTAPTIVAGTGGVSCGGAGAVNLPAALNSALTIFLLVNFQGGGNNVNNDSAVILGSTAPRVGLVLSSKTSHTPTPQTIQGGSRISVYPNTMNSATYTFAGVQGVGSLALTMGTFDAVFINGSPLDTLIRVPLQNTSAGIQTTGQFQLCGATGMFYTGTIYAALFWNRVLTDAEIFQVHLAELALRQPLGVTFNPSGINKSSVNQVVYDGDSLTAGQDGSPIDLGIFLNGTWNTANQGVGGRELIKHAIPEAPVLIDPFYTASAAQSVDVVWLGTNDLKNSSLTAAQTFAGLRPYCVARRTLGWKCLVATMISRDTQDANKNSYNALIRQHWSEFADGLIDIAAEPIVGADNANTNTTYFAGNKIHVNPTTDYNYIAPVFQRAINRLYGNNDFSSATVYGSAASAAVATTAGSESTNTVTLTFGATPANCITGSVMTVAGTTPAGYSGNWQILTRSSTQVTYFSTTASMGNITVQGTGVCSQQQDADKYAILNFGAGNFTLESCIGYTGQNIYLRNINAAASTLVPFGSETITGAGATPTTLAANSTAILQAQLVSAAAGGCNWVRIQ